MSGWTRLGLVMLATASIQFAGCRHENAPGVPDAVGWTALRYQRRLKVGDTLFSTSLMCVGGGSRKIGARDATQLVSFQTLSDCTSCALHPLVLDSLWRAKAVKFDMIVVAYAHAPDKGKLSRTADGRLGRPVCLDTAGLYWSKHDLIRTPLTVLVQGGVIRYMTDNAFTDSSAPRLFLRDVADVLSRRSR